MKNAQHGNYGLDELRGPNSNEILEVYKRKYAGKPVSIYYNPNDINEFYVKEIEEEIIKELTKKMIPYYIAIYAINIVGLFYARKMIKKMI